MSLSAAMIPDLVKLVRDKRSYLNLNHELFEIYQGCLLEYVEKELAAQLSPQSYAQAQFRIPPINVLRRIIDKLAKVYAVPPMRTTTGTDEEKELVAWYQDAFRINQRMATANAYFNLFKNCLIEPFVHRPDPTLPGKPRLRIISSDKFVPISWDAQDPTVLTAVVIYQGKYRADGGKSRKYYMAADAQTFFYFDEDGKNITAQMAPADNPMGLNVYGRLPYVYVNRSLDAIMPVQDSDMRRMATLIPTLLADTNYASMFQAFSILYGIDVDDQGLKMAPNAFWAFKSTKEDGKPQVGTLTPQMQVDGSLNLIASQLAFWLNSRGIRPGAIGEVNGTNFSSGIAKMIDEMDTAEDRKEQIPYFKDAEEELWDLVLHTMHPVWKMGGWIENQADFSPSSFVTVTFPIRSRSTRGGTFSTRSCLSLIVA